MGTDDAGRMRETRLIVYREDVDRINRVLEEFLKLSGAKQNILIDKEGHPITSVGEPGTFSIDTLSALVASSFASTQTMARILGEDRFTLLSQQGNRDHLQLALVADRCLLVTAWDDRTTVGMIRLYGMEAVKKLNDIFGEIARRTDAPGEDPDGAGVFARLRPKPQGPQSGHAAPPPPEDPGK
jgi:predicted regulator of Ras-like GTPase activity (Roadblock/LC7/MglB family)